MKKLYLVHTPDSWNDDILFRASDIRKVRARLKKMLFENEDNDLETLKDVEAMLADTVIKRVKVYEV
jgi:hypothetical protein